MFSDDNVLVTSALTVPGRARSRSPQMFVGFVASWIHQREPGQEQGTIPARGTPAWCRMSVYTPEPAHLHFSLARASSPFARTSVSWPCLSLCSPASPQSQPVGGSPQPCTIHRLEFGRFLTLPVHLFNKYLLNTDSEPGTMLGSDSRAESKADMIPGFMELTCWWGRHTEMDVLWHISYEGKEQGTWRKMSYSRQLSGKASLRR